MGGGSGEEGPFVTCGAARGHLAGRGAVRIRVRLLLDVLRVRFRLRFARFGAACGSGTHVADLVGELVDQDAVAERGLADVGAGAAVHRKPVALFPHDLDGAVRGTGLPGEEGAEPGGVRAADGDARAEPGTGEVRALLVGDESPPVQGDDPVGRPGRFLGIDSW